MVTPTTDHGGVRRGLLGGSTASAVVFIINAAVTGWAWQKPLGLPPGFSSDMGRRVLFEGSCDKSRQLSLYLHLVINLLSSVLLGASNFAMQYLSAPTRREVDAAHKRGEWLEVGVHSLSNLRWGRISRGRSSLWGVLVLSSLPLHLL
jgi:hypothetical protein